MHPSGVDKTGQEMTDAAQARDLLSRLERMEALRARTSIADVRPMISRRLRAAPGMLENIRRQRRKTIPNWFMERLREALVAALQAEVAELQHEIHVHLQVGADPRRSALAAAMAKMDAAKKIFAGE